LLQRFSAAIRAFNARRAFPLRCKLGPSYVNLLQTTFHSNLRLCPAQLIPRSILSHVAHHA
jgi:hypothetical protein